MYGKDNDLNRKEFVKEVILFEIELLKQDPTKELLVAATLMMANKIIDKETFDELWREIKMFKVLEFAEEKGYDRGQKDGYDKGKNDGYDKGKNDGKNEGALNTAK
ncbi:hypothetical protein MHK_004661, partial [Candidatus Magnetomorum sp. HK-1]